jgi:VIT1/CCC1 family predicted Fe2+/Mn2+ transporter
VSVAPVPEHHHRDVSGGAARAAVFGISDGLVSNVGLILGVAGAISMAAGEYNSMRVQSELLQRELDMERRELHHNPHVETVELALIYQSRGMDPDRARELAEATMQDPDQALQAHAREELGIDPNDLGSPIAAATSSLVAFSIGAFVPLLPWLFGGGTAATVSSLVLALVAAAIVGTIVSRFTEKHRGATVLRQIAFTAIPAAITYAIGSAVGVAT